MRFARTALSGLVAELPPEVVTSADIERRLAPLYRRLRLPEGRGGLGWPGQYQWRRSPPPSSAAATNS